MDPWTKCADGIVQEFVAIELISQAEQTTYRQQVLQMFFEHAEIEAVRVIFNPVANQ